MNPTLLKGRGAVARPIDVRDYTFDQHPLAGSGVLPLPSAFIPTIYDQGPIIGNCGPEGLAFRANFLFPGTVNSPKWQSEQVRLRDGFSPESNMGTDIRVNYKAGKTSGFVDLSKVPDDALTATPDKYWSPESITAPLSAEAAARQIKGYGFKNPGFTFAQLQTDLATFKMLECRINLGNRFFQNAAGVDTYDPALLFPLQLGKYIDDHFIELISPDVAQLFGITNPNPNVIYWATQWGKNYGAGGIGWFDWTYMPFVREIGVCW